MLDVYRHVANRVGTSEAIAFSHELSAWHDAMVKYRRQIVRLGFDPDRVTVQEDGPSADAPELWHRAVEVFGAHANELEFLRQSAERTREAAVS